MYVWIRINYLKKFHFDKGVTDFKKKIQTKSILESLSFFVLSMSGSHNGCYYIVIPTWIDIGLPTSFIEFNLTFGCALRGKATLGSIWNQRNIMITNKYHDLFNILTTEFHWTQPRSQYKGSFLSVTDSDQISLLLFVIHLYGDVGSSSLL